MRILALALVTVDALVACSRPRHSFEGPLAAVADSVLSSAVRVTCGRTPLARGGKPDTSLEGADACTSSGDTTVVVYYDHTGRVLLVLREWMPDHPTDSVYLVLLASLKVRYGEPRQCQRKNDPRLPYHVYWNGPQYHPTLATTTYGAVVLAYGLAPSVCDNAAA